MYVPDSGRTIPIPMPYAILINKKKLKSPANADSKPVIAWMTPASVMTGYLPYLSAIDWNPDPNVVPIYTDVMSRDLSKVEMCHSWLSTGIMSPKTIDSLP